MDVASYSKIEIGQNVRNQLNNAESEITVKENNIKNENKINKGKTIYLGCHFKVF